MATRDELMAMFDLGGKTAPSQAGDPLTAAASRPKGEPSSNPYVFDLDRWGRRRGMELAEANPLVGLDATAWGDLYHAAFYPAPKIVAGCQDATRETFIRDLLETTEYHSLHVSTARNAYAAEAAAVTFGNALSALKTARNEDQNGHKTGQGAGGGPSDPNGFDSLMAAAGAVRAAETAVSEILEAHRGLFPGFAPGDPEGKTDPKAVADAFRRVRRSYRLQAILDAAGRFRRVAQSKQRHKVDHGNDEVVGVTIGDEIARLVPPELARLALPELELDGYRRIAEHQAMVWEKQGTEAVAKGPIVVLVDESSSMDRSGKITAAKGLALTMAWVANQQNRWCCLISFSGGSVYREVVLPPYRWNEVLLMDWLEHFFNGGTTAEVLCEVLPFTLWDQLVRKGMTRGKTDILVLTDGAVNVEPAKAERFLAWKTAEKARLITINIQASGGALDVLSDEVHEVASLDASCEAVGRVLAS